MRWPVDPAKRRKANPVRVRLREAFSIGSSLKRAMQDGEPFFALALEAASKMPAADQGCTVSSQ
jgi:hypothetical protein